MDLKNPGHVERACWEKSGRKDTHEVLLQPFRETLLLASGYRMGLSFFTDPGLQHYLVRYISTMTSKVLLVDSYK